MSTLLDNLDVFAMGFGNTVILFLYSALLSLLGGLVLASMRVCPVVPLRVLGALYVNLVRNTPLTLILLVMAVAFPKLDIISLDYMTLAVIALSLYTSTYVAETVRAGINTVPIGQVEVARALGMGFAQNMRLIVIPQAVRSVIPSLMSVLIALLKNTTVAGGFSVMEAGNIRAYLDERSEPSLVVILWVMFFFILLIFLLTGLQRFLENKFRLAR